MRPLDVVTRLVYAVMAAFYLTIGTLVLLLGTGVLPAGLQAKIFDLGQNIPDWMHLIQEIGTLWIFVGILFVWFTRHYARSVKFHWAVTVLFGLDAWVHCFSAYGRFEFGRRQVINAIPFAVFLILGLLRYRFAVDTPPATD